MFTVDAVSHSENGASRLQQQLDSLKSLIPSRDGESAPDDQGGFQDADFGAEGGDFDSGGTDFGGSDDSSFA